MIAAMHCFINKLSKIHLNITHFCYPFKQNGVFAGKRALCIMQPYNADSNNDYKSSIFKQYHPSSRNICDNQELIEGLLVEAKTLSDKVCIFTSDG